MYEKDGVVYAGNPVPLLKVIAVQILDGYCMRLEFSNGEVKEFDFALLLDTPCFQPLREKTLFDSVYLDHGVPSWNGGNIDIAPESLFDAGDEICPQKAGTQAPAAGLPPEPLPDGGDYAEDRFVG
jgi:hypothetical protein